MCFWFLVNVVARGNILHHFKRNYNEALIQKVLCAGQARGHGQKVEGSDMD